MRYRPIGSSQPEIKVSEIGFGCWTMGGPNWSLADGKPVGWADVDEGDVTKGIKVGLDAGVNHWDNADVYGNGRAERLLREIFNSLGVDRREQIIATKIGHFRGTAEHPYEPHHIRHQCEQSLRNLGTDYIDIYYLHHDDFGDHLEDAAQTMHALRDEGKIRAIGQSAYTDEGFEASLRVVRPDVLQSWANMIKDNFIRPGSALQDLMDEAGCGFVAFAPLAKGILLGKFDPDKPPTFEPGDVRNQMEQFTAEGLRELAPGVERLKNRFGSSIEELASAACRFVLAHPHVCSVIPGFRNAKQARCNVRAAEDEPMDVQAIDFCRAAFAQPVEV